MIDDAGSGKKVERDLDEAARRLQERLVRAMAQSSALVASRLRREKMSSGKKDTVPNQLGARTGRLRASTVPSPVVSRPLYVEGGISFGTEYAAVHVGPSGQVTTIRPVRKKWLTIPLDAAKTKAGVARGSARSGMWGETFFQRDVGPDGKERLILYGKRVTQRGASAGQARGKIVPLFLLVKEVKVPVRITFEEISVWFLSRFREDMRGRIV